MDFQSLNTFTWILTYIVYTVWAILFIALFVGLFNKNWTLFKRTLKYLTNSLVFIIAWTMILELALIVRPPISTTKEASIKALKNWIIEKQIKDVYIALVTIIILFAINLLFYYKVEHKKFRKDLLILTLSDSIVLALGIWLTGQLAYIGLLQEINLEFR